MNRIGVSDDGQFQSEFEVFSVLIDLEYFRAAHGMFAEGASNLNSLILMDSPQLDEKSRRMRSDLMEVRIESLQSMWNLAMFGGGYGELPEVGNGEAGFMNMAMSACASRESKKTDQHRDAWEKITGAATRGDRSEIEDNEEAVDVANWLSGTKLFHFSN